MIGCMEVWNSDKQTEIQVKGYQHFTLSDNWFITKREAYTSVR